MLKLASKHTLVLLIIAFAFIYRFALMTMNTFPPGADIGLHESVLKSITVGKEGFFWNYYQMGGGVSATNPGYHIFVSAIIAATGITDYLAHSLVASFFSSLVVLAAFLIVRRAWNDSAALIAALLFAFSSGDITILIWGGYPNVITLLLIPLVFYLFIQRSNISTITYYTLTSLLIGAMFLTHLFSAFVFIAIAAVVLLIIAVFPRRFELSWSQVASWLAPIALGALLVLAYLLGAIPSYFGSEGTIAKTESQMKQALLETRIISPTAVILSLIPVVLFFLLSKINKGKFITLLSILSTVWIMVPALLTQSYLLDVYLDYERFLYFLFFPIITCAALLVQVGALSLTSMFDGLQGRLRKGRPNIKSTSKFVSRRILYPVFVIGLLLASLFFIPIFAPPHIAVYEAESYQAMTNLGYEALEWIKTNTPAKSVCVADAYFGWWLSGFGERPTLSAVDPQYLILTHEFEAAQVAGDLLDTNYFIDNGFIRVKQNSSFIDSNPEFSAWLNDSYVPYRFFSLRDSETNFLYRDANGPQHFNFAQADTTNVHVENRSDSALFVITIENQAFTCTEEIALYRGARFARVSITLKTNVEEVSFDWLHIPFQLRGIPKQYIDSIAAIDTNAQTMSQIIFTENTLGNDVFLRENPSSYEMVYQLGGKNFVQVHFFVGLTQYPTIPENTQADYIQKIIANNRETYLNRISDLPLDFFDYKTAIKQWNVSFIIIRTAESVSRLANDPFFRLVFKNDEVAIFEAKRIT